MDFKDLEYFAAIARCGNITRAAQQLYVSQPTLSKFLQKLEGDTGLVLFQRAGRRLELTYAGQRYLAHAERLLSQKREMDAELTDLLRADTGVLHVGMPPFRCSFSLPEVLPAFRAQFPQVQFRIEEAPSAELDRKLLEGEIDLAFYMSFARHPGLSYRVLRRDRMYAVFGKGHPLEQAAAREGSFAWEWLEGGRPCCCRTRPSGRASIFCRSCGAAACIRPKFWKAATSGQPRRWPPTGTASAS